MLQRGFGEKKMTRRRMKGVGRCGSTSSPSNCRPGAEECGGVEPLADNLFDHNTPLPYRDTPRPHAVIDCRCAKKKKRKIKLGRRLCGCLLSLSPPVSESSGGRGSNLALQMQNLDFLCRFISLMRFAAPQQHQTSVSLMVPSVWSRNTGSGLCFSDSK